MPTSARRPASYQLRHGLLRQSDRAALASLPTTRSHGSASSTAMGVGGGLVDDHGRRDPHGAWWGSPVRRPMAPHGTSNGNGSSTTAFHTTWPIRVGTSRESAPTNRVDERALALAGPRPPFGGGAGVHANHVAGARRRREQHERAERQAPLSDEPHAVEREDHSPRRHHQWARADAVHAGIVRCRSVRAARAQASPSGSSMRASTWRGRSVPKCRRSRVAGFGSERRSVTRGRRRRRTRCRRPRSGRRARGRAGCQLP